MKKRPILFLTAACLSLTVSISSFAQQTAPNTHSHNDYEQPVPFWTAWQESFGSIEADVWLVDGRLLIGHSREEIKSGRTLEEYYVKPLLSCVEHNNGYPYADTTKHLQILIDVKVDSSAAVDALVLLLNKYPALEKTSIKWVISGSRPAISLYTTYPPFIMFDGILRATYPPEALARIAIMSDDIRSFTRTRWTGQDELPAIDVNTVREAITRSHNMHLPVRLYGTPDTELAWRQLISLNVDYLNTDHIRDLAVYLRNHFPAK